MAIPGYSYPAGTPFEVMFPEQKPMGLNPHEVRAIIQRRRDAADLSIRALAKTLNSENKETREKALRSARAEMSRVAERMLEAVKRESCINPDEDDVLHALRQAYRAVMRAQAHIDYEELEGRTGRTFSDAVNLATEAAGVEGVDYVAYKREDDGYAFCNADRAAEAIPKSRRVKHCPAPPRVRFTKPEPGLGSDLPPDVRAMMFPQLEVAA